MELSEEVMNDLKCCNCENYLTCTPIMVKPNGDSFCGRCSPPKKEKHLVIRNNAYEKLASAIIFHCRYKNEGCVFKSSIAELEEHELYCVYHEFKCPVLPLGTCSWVGSRLQFITHFKDDHSELLLQHPCNVKPNIAKNCEKNMITLIDDKLFLVQIKYNVSSSKFWHGVRLINNPKLTKFYEYNFEILSDRGIFSKKWNVLEQEFFQFYDDPQKEISLNSLLNLLGRFEDLTFKITITEKEDIMHCSDCAKSLPVVDAEGELCADCSGISLNDNFPYYDIKCNKNAIGCLYVDKDINILKHQAWFCEFAENKCTLCDLNVTDLFNHYFNNHRGSVHLNFMQHKNLLLNHKYSAILILNDNDVIFLCLWNFTRSGLEFKVISNLSKTDNSKYDCILKMINPRNNFQKKFKLSHDNNNLTYDWLAVIKSNSENPVVGLFSESLSFQTGAQTLLSSKYSFELKIVKNSE